MSHVKLNWPGILQNLRFMVGLVIMAYACFVDAHVPLAILGAAIYLKKV